jgi:glycine/D-amino acid oxidase-like deaminating enzyme
MNQIYDVVVIGAGSVGTPIAYSLAELNLKVAASAPAAGGNAGGTPKPAPKKTN